MKLYLIETFYDTWLVRANSKDSAMNIIDPQKHIRKNIEVSIKEVTLKGNAEIVRKW